MFERIKGILKSFWRRRTALDYLKIISDLGPDAYGAMIHVRIDMKMNQMFPYSTILRDIRILEERKLIASIDMHLDDMGRLYYLTYLGTRTLKKLGARRE